MEEDKELFRVPFKLRKDGTYITTTQLKMYLSTKEGKEAFMEASDDFFEYLDRCRIYNLVYDENEKDAKSARLFWDHKNECVAVQWPKGGKVSEMVKSLVASEDDEDEDFFFY
jgi:hypothetical protein|tara:strand:+ start:2209 stop:2547 length:339 start_codon:yes stop_codon:yes gene_type:complete